MKILVSGSLGLTGSAVVKLFKEKEWEVVGIDSNVRAELFGTKKQKLNKEDRNIDIRDEKAINALFVTEKFDAIVHTAAQPSHDWAKNNPLMDFDINARGTLILLEATRKYCPNATFVYVSTDKVYGENMFRVTGEFESRYDNAFPFGEHLGLDFAGQRSLFGCSKTAADIYVQEYGNYFGMKTVCFRPGCITGSKHQGAEYHGFLAYLVKCIREGIPYKIFGYKGKQVRDQIHADDVASAFYEFIRNPKISAVYNIGGGIERSLSIIEAIELIEEYTGKKALTEYISESRKGDRQWDVHDMSKFQQDYPNWKPKYSLSDIIKEICQ